jgi:hypothetical protein
MRSLIEQEYLDDLLAAKYPAESLDGMQLAAADTGRLPEVVVTGEPEAPTGAGGPAGVPEPTPKPIKKPVPAPMQATTGEIKPIQPSGGMGALKVVGELIQSGAEKIDFDVLGLPGIGTLTLKDLTVGDLGKVLVNIAEGFPPVTGSGQTLSPTLQSAELINAAPAVSLAYKGGKKLVKSLAPVAGEMLESYAQKTGITQFALPRVDSIERFPVGPANIKPKVIAENKPLYRETNVDGLTDLLRQDGQFSYANVFVTDNADIALGQGSNKGIKVQFRANAVSGEEHRKPMTGNLAGREYKADVFAPKAIESITFANEADFKKMKGLSAKVLRDQFERTTEGTKDIVFVRKAQSPSVNVANESLTKTGAILKVAPDSPSIEVKSAPKLNTPAFKNWFGNSKVVDEKGKPIVVYHGTKAAVSDDFAFDRKKNITAADFYFTPNKETASIYGAPIPVYLKAENLIDIRPDNIEAKETNALQKVFKLIGEDYGFNDFDSFVDVVTGGRMYEVGNNQRFQNAVLGELNNIGFDGVRMVDAGFGGALDESIVVFNSAQIKSVFNKGTFDPKDPRILYGGGAAGAATAGEEKK